MKINAEKLNVNFVKMVETNPCIWDSNSKYYRNKKLVKFAWDKISKEMDVPVESCSDRWRKIRDALFRSIKRHAIKKGNRKRKPYYLTPYLNFLLPLAMISKKPNNTTSPDDNRILEYESEDSKPGPFLNEIKANETTIESIRIGTELQSTSAMQISDKFSIIIKNDAEEHRNNEQYFDMIDETESVLSMRRNLNEEDDENDSDMSFFKSLLRDVRKMNDRQNRKFRLKVLQVIDEIFDHISAGEGPERDHQIHSQTLSRQQRQKRKLLNDMLTC